MANKKGKTRAAKTPAKEAGGTTSRAIAPRTAHKNSFSLDGWLSHVRDHATTMATAGMPEGACLVPNPQGGNDCVLTDETTCTTKLGGTWIGGPC